MLDPNTIFTLVLGSILTIVGGFLATYYSQRLARSGEKRKAAREKCQEIFELFEQINRWIKNEIDKWQERADPDKLDIFGQRKVNPPVSQNLECPINRLLMLVKLYVPPLEKLASELDNKVELFNKVEQDFHNQPEIDWERVPDFLTEQKEELIGLEQRFTSEIKKFMARN